jgi:hypothetical protein
VPGDPSEKEIFLQESAQAIADRVEMLIRVASANDKIEQLCKNLVLDKHSTAVCDHMVAQLTQKDPNDITAMLVICYAYYLSNNNRIKARNHYDEALQT